MKPSEVGVDTLNFDKYYDQTIADNLWTAVLDGTDNIHQH